MSGTPERCMYGSNEEEGEQEINITHIRSDIHVKIFSNEENKNKNQHIK